MPYAFVKLNIEGKAIYEKCFANGLIINCTQGNILRFMPALNVTKKQANKALHTLEKALKKAVKHESKNSKHEARSTKQI